jgi:predicted phosphodiesterase
MANNFFSNLVGGRFNPGAVLDISKKDPRGQYPKALIIGDFHMGSGVRDDLSLNGELLIRCLEEYYYQGGWHLILNGDIEELAKNSLKDIRTEWARLYRLFDLFAAENRLYKTIGNHDEGLLFEKDYPYPLYNALRVETGTIPLYVYHGHQSSRVYTDYNNLVMAGLRYFLKPIGIRNISAARSPHRRFYVEKQAYRFSMDNNCISVIGHTHRPLFESLARSEYIKFEIERLCRDYPNSAEKPRIFLEVQALRQELGKLKRKERRGVRQSLYGDLLPVPCLFNAGSAIGKKGINAIELDRRHISLVYWFVRGRGMKFIDRGWYRVEKLGDSEYRRSVLNRDSLAYIKARIELLGGRDNP